MTAWINAPGGTWVPSNGDDAQSIDATRWGARFYLEWKSSAWQVKKLKILEPFGERELGYIW